jgi:hypothetical protein
MEQMSTEMEQQQQTSHSHRNSKTKDGIEWRRNMVLELTSQGRTEREIAQFLKVGNGTVHRDIAFLNKQAHDNLRYHINQRVPQQYQRCCNGLEQVLRMAWNIVIKDSVNQTNKLQALSLISDCYKYQMELSTNAGIIEDAMKFYSAKTELLNITMPKLERKDDNSKTESSNEATNNNNTTNGVF